MAKERTPEETAEKKAKNDAKRKIKRDALMALITFVNGRKNVPSEIKASVKIVTPGVRVGTGGGGPSKLTVFTAFFNEFSSVPEQDIFDKFKAGRAEMRKIAVDLIKKNDPKNRVWVSLDTSAEEYLVEGYGADAPADWAGYRPVEVDETEIV